MRMTIKDKDTWATVGEVDLQPSNLRRLTEVEYLGKTYDVADTETAIERGVPVATIWVRPRR